MKILHVIDSGGLYGAETVLLNLMVEQERMGLKPVLASIGDPCIGDKPLEQAAVNLGLRVEKFRMHPGPNYWGAFRLLKFAHNENVALLHTHGYKGNILLGLIPRWIRKIPIVASLHGYTATNGISRMRLYEWLDAASLRFIDQVVLVNNAMRQHPRLKKIPIRFEVVNNGLPVLNGIKAKLDPDIAGFCRTGFVICSMGRLSREKGFDILLHALEIASRKNPLLKLVIIGEGSERSALINQIQAFALSDRVMLAGFRHGAKDHLPLMDVLVIPSFTEGLPMVALEGMQAGLPIIATRVGGLPEVLEDGQVGLLVEKKNPESLAQAILKVAGDKAFRDTIASRAKKRVGEFYNSARMAEGYLSIYNGLIEHNFRTQEERIQ